jgi:hypothetical protein
MTIPALFERALRSREFQSSFVQRFVRSFPEKHCLCFVHIPKCAGTDLSFHLKVRFPALLTAKVNPLETTQLAFFRAVKDLVLESYLSDCIYIHGHTTLKTYAAWGVARPQDHIFTILRDPIAAMISQVNYVVTRMMAEDGPSPAADAMEWRNHFGVNDRSILRSPADLRRVWRQILRDPGVVPPNNACQYLGEGDRDSAIAAMVKYNVEVTDVPRYRGWLASRWQVRNFTHHNRSRTFMLLDDLDADDIGYIRASTIQDQALYDYVASRLDHCGQTSLRGRELD